MNVDLWPESAPGVLSLPSGRRIRGRGLRDGPPQVRPDFGVYLLGKAPAELPWTSRWLRCPDFWMPDPDQARTVLADALYRAATERVEVACGGGRGRTGLALACLAVLDGVRPERAVAFVRAGYHPGAVETPWQHRFVRRFGTATAVGR